MPIRSADASPFRTPRCYLYLEPAVSFCTRPSIKETTFYSLLLPKDFAVISNHLVAKTPLNSGKSTIGSGTMVVLRPFYNWNFALNWDYMERIFNPHLRTASNASLNYSQSLICPSLTPFFQEALIFAVHFPSSPLARPSFVALSKLTC